MIPKTLRPEGIAFRTISSTVMVGMLLWRVLGLPSKWLPLKRLRQIQNYWNRNMQVNYIRSLGAKLPHDQLCRLSMPDSFAAKARVPAPHRLSPDSIRDFSKTDFLSLSQCSLKKR